MTFNSRETSTFEGAPFELYRWSLSAETWLQTSGDVPRSHLGQVHEPATLLRNEVDQNGEASSGNVIVTLDLENPVAQLFLEGPPSRPLSLIVTGGHDGEAETVCIFTGRVLSAKLDEVCELTCASRQSVWKQPVPALNYQSQCPLRWGTARCGVDRWAYRVPATLTGVSGLVLTAAAFATKPDGHFKGGWIEAGSSLQMILAHTGNQVTLATALPGLAPGDVVDAYPGCQGTEEDCSGRYNNLVNHLGFKRIPTRQPFGSGGI